MSSLINENVDVLYAPNMPIWKKMWHGLQTVVEGKIEKDGSNIPHAFSPIISLGVQPVIPEGSEVEFDEGIEGEMADWQLICADAREGKAGKIVPIYIPKSSYTIHDNRHLFDCMVKSAEKVLGQDGFEITTVGTVGSYSQFLVSIAIKGNESFDVGNLANGQADEWKQFFNLNSSHNGVVTSSNHISTTRMVCFNTLVMSLEAALTSGQITKRKHSKNSMEGLTPKVFAKDLENWIEASKLYASTLKAMKSVPMGKAEFKSFASGVFTNETSDKLSTVSFNRIEEMESLFAKGMGNEGKSVYDALNAFTEYFTHGNGLGKKAAINKRVASANFGRGNGWKQEALRIASNEGEFKDCLKRGETLLHDRLLVESVNN